jgi:hypothetical protein
LVENLKDTNLPTDIQYNFNLTSNDINIIKDYLVFNNEWRGQVDNVFNIIDFLLYIGDQKINDFIQKYVDNCNDIDLIFKIQDYVQILYHKDQNYIPDNLNSNIGGLYISLQEPKSFDYQPQYLKISNPNNIVKFPHIKVTNRYNYIKHGVIGYGQYTNKIWDGVINFDESFWLKDFPWTEFNVGLAGGFLVSSLQGILQQDQDIDLYILDTNQN